LIFIRCRKYCHGIGFKHSISGRYNVGGRAAVQPHPQVFRQPARLI
jgi:hypothetical protein